MYVSIYGKNIQGSTGFAFLRKWIYASTAESARIIFLVVFLLSCWRLGYCLSCCCFHAICY